MLNSKAKQCNAKTRSGCKCRNPAMLNGKCRLHGGKSTGPSKGSQNHKTPGSIYSKFITEEEQEVVDSAELDSLDYEIKLYRARLYRLLKEEQAYKDELELRSRTTQTPVVGGMPITPDDGEAEELIETKQYAKRDYHALINQTTARLQSLIQLRQSLTGQKLDFELKRMQVEDQNVKRIEVRVKQEQKLPSLSELFGDATETKSDTTTAN